MMDRKKLDNASRELESLDGEDRWRQATGLSVGGDPSGVTPEHLVVYRDHVTRVVMAAREVLAPRVYVSREAAIDALRERLAMLDADYPEG